MGQIKNFCHMDGGRTECWLEYADPETAFTADNALSLLRDCLGCEKLREHLTRADGRRDSDRILARALTLMFDQLQSYDRRLQNTGESLRRRVTELTIVNEVSDALAHTSDVEQATQIFLLGVTAGGAIGLNRALYLQLDDGQLRGTLGLGNLTADEGRRTWMQLAETGHELSHLIKLVRRGEFKPDAKLNEQLHAVTLPADGESLPARVLADREVRRINPSTESLGHPFLDELYANLPFVAVPLFLEHESVGVVIADNFVSRMPITDDTISLLQTLANQAAAEIVSNRLYADLQNQLAETEHLYELLRENQNYLLQHERLVDMGKLATTVAHEIKTPLVAIGGFARRALKKIESPTHRPVRELEIIIREVQRLERITAEILDYSKEVQLRLEPVDLQATLDDAIEVVEGRINQAGIEITRHYSDTPIEILADARRVKQVVLNLLENAIEAMSPNDGQTPSGGKVTLSTKMTDRFAVVECRDNGPGISPELIEQVFAPFFTTKPTGSGLGLTVSRRIISDHGGRITIDTPESGGTRFTIELPRELEIAAHMEGGNAHG